MRTSYKIIFWIIIGIFAFSSFIAFTSFSFQNPNANNPKFIVSPEEKQKAEDEKLAQTLGQGMEGVVKKLSADDAKKKDATHYLDVNGVVLALLNADTGVNLDDYLDKNVKVWGDITQTTQDKQIVMKVKKIEER